MPAPRLAAMAVVRAGGTLAEIIVWQGGALPQLSIVEAAVLAVGIQVETIA